MRFVFVALTAVLALGACAGNREPPRTPAISTDLYPGESVRMRELINRYAAFHDIPPTLLHKVIQRESDYRADARNGPYWGLMQILPETAGTMGYDGAAAGLLDAETNLRWAGAYLRGAWIVSDGDIDEAVSWFASGYYYEARDRCLLIETGLRNREVRRDCA